jgi:hypothetical protein
MGPREVNTTSTYIGGCGDICIWRKEEMLKVLSHEMGHCLGFDTYPVPIEVHNIIKNWFLIPTNTQIKINEAYVEMWAVIINTAAISHQFNLNFLNLLDYERKFSLWQIAKILNYFKFSKFSDFFQIHGWKDSNRKKTQYLQTTSVLSYYIIKGALLFSIDKFVEYCNTFHHPNPFHFNSSNWDLYLNLIQNSLQNEEFNKCVNLNLSKLQNKLTKRTTFWHNSLRMTALEI